MDGRQDVNLLAQAMIVRSIHFAVVFLLLLLMLDHISIVVTLPGSTVDLNSVHALHHLRKRPMHLALAV